MGDLRMQGAEGDRTLLFLGGDFGKVDAKGKAHTTFRNSQGPSVAI
jgi:hypothetical protein